MGASGVQPPSPGLSGPLTEKDPSGGPQVREGGYIAQPVPSGSSLLPGRQHSPSLLGPRAALSQYPLVTGGHLHFNRIKI